MTELKLRELIDSQNRGKFIRAKEILNESILWLEHIERIENQYNQNISGLEGSYFLFNDIITNYCSLINWLATISLTKDRVTNKQIANFLHIHFQWPKHVCETFMNCVRNPSVHMGRVFPWGIYAADWKENESVHGEGYLFHGTINLNIDERVLSSSSSLLIHPRNPNARVKRKQIFEIGFIESGAIMDGPDGPHFGIEFYIPAIKVKVRSTIVTIFSKFMSRTPEQLENFEALSHRLNLTRVPAPENCA